MKPLAPGHGLAIPTTAEERRKAAAVAEGTPLSQMAPVVRCLVDAYLTNPNAASLKTARAALRDYYRGWRTGMGGPIRKLKH